MKDYIEKNRERFLQELFDLLRIPSVSADSKYKNDVIKTANFIKDKLLTAGADKAEICETAGHPVVYAEKILDKKLPTVLVYGHYDVQPPDPLELWNSPPFEPVIKDDRIYARGACDDKGQMYMHIKALETMLKHNALKCNIKFLIEGEEEIGSDNLDKFLVVNKEKLKADVVLISDTGLFSNEYPSITVGLRGLSYIEVEVIGPKRDLHSGMYGGAVANPVNILCEMIASLKDKNNKITIPGFYDDVAELTKEERAEMSEVPFDLEEYKKSLDIEEVHGEAGYNTLERVSIRPTLDLNGIWGGYTGEGAKTVLPSKAFAKLSMRLVPNQSSKKITELFKKHFESIAPKSVKVKVKPHHGGEPALTPTDSVAYKAASKAFEEAWGKTPIPMREGGSIPIVNLFKKELGLNTVLMGFGLDEDAIHSPNESFRVFNYFKGIETITLFYKYYGKLNNGDLEKDLHS
ncbi:MAG: dipeptidase [Cytophagaceae bacterium]|nr:dipeptidase [Cytophagaceae bacterium]